MSSPSPSSGCTSRPGRFGGKKEKAHGTREAAHTNKWLRDFRDRHLTKDDPSSFLGRYEIASYLYGTLLYEEYASNYLNAQRSKQLSEWTSFDQQYQLFMANLTATEDVASLTSIPPELERKWEKLNSQLDSISSDMHKTVDGRVIRPKFKIKRSLIVKQGMVSRLPSMQL